MTLKIKNDKRRVIDFGVFGYGGSNDGVMELKVLDFLIHDLDEYDSVDEKIGFALDLVPSASYARKERNTAIKRIRSGDKNNKKGVESDADDDNPDSDGSVSSSGNLCFVDDPSFTPETRYLLPLQDSLARIWRKVEKNALPTMTKMQKAGALRSLARNLSAVIHVKPDQPGYYALFFYNCKKANRNKSPVPVTFRVKISQFNVIGTLESGKQYRSFLPYGDTRLPELYLFAFVIFAALTTLWHVVLYGGLDTNSVGGNLLFKKLSRGGTHAVSASTHKRSSAKRGGKDSTAIDVDTASPTGSPPPMPPKLIHKLMYVLLILKCLSLFFEAVMLSRRRSSGKLSATIDYIFYGFQTVKGFFLFTVILLLGSGWSLLKPFLSDRDRRLMLLLLPLQLIVNVAIAVIGESSEGSKYWSWWRDTLRLVDVGCCIAVLLPVITSIHALRSSSDRAQQRRLGRLRQFRTFYIVLVSYMFITRVALDYVAASAPYYLTWAPAAMGEIGALFLYVVAGYMFRPSAQQEWEREDQLAAAEDVEDAEEIELGDAEEIVINDDEDNDLEFTDEDDNDNKTGLTTGKAKKSKSTSGKVKRGKK